MPPDARQAFIRRSVRDIMVRARVINLKQAALRTAEAFAKSDGSEAELTRLLARPGALEAERMRGIKQGPDASA